MPEACSANHHAKQARDSMLSRRLLLTTTGLATLSACRRPLHGGNASNFHDAIRAVVFDGFPIFDPRPILNVVRHIGPQESSDGLAAKFQSRLFEYQWLRALGPAYQDFLSIADDAILFAARSEGFVPTPDERRELRSALTSLTAWPDARESLSALRRRGLTLAILSNMTPHMLSSGCSRNGLSDLFSNVLSTDTMETYKPDHRAYQMAVDALALPKEQILFVAFAGWDLAGASWFGFPTFWVNRLGRPAEGLGAHSIGESSDLRELAALFATGPLRTSFEPHLSRPR